MPLTAKQEAFALALVEGLSQTAAYKQAYAPPGMSDKTIAEAASRLAANSKVLARVEALRSQAADAATLTLTEHLRDLKELRQEARSAEQYSPAVSAEISRGKAAGFYVERTEEKRDITVRVTYAHERPARLRDLTPALTNGNGHGG